MTTHVTNLRMVATPTAASCARVFVAHSLKQWQAEVMTDEAQLVVSELVTNSVRAMDVDTPPPDWADLEGKHLLHVGLYAHGKSMHIEVWDSSEEPPVRQKAGGEGWAEGGRGLHIVDALALHVGHFYPLTGGKVVWAELALPESVQPLPDYVTKDLRNVVCPDSDPECLDKFLEMI